MRGERDSRCVAALLAVAVSAGSFAAAEPAPGGDLSRLSLADLANVQVTSVLKSPEPLSQAAASIFVITHDAIVRSGVSTLIGALRLAPNLLVTQYGSNNFVISARGFCGNPAAQNFSNKLLILIDGRSVYSPLYSGIYLDTLDVFMDDIERIEVISGPGATLWGANAINGVVFARADYGADGVAHKLQRPLPNHPINGLPEQARRINNLRMLIASVGLHPILLVTDDEDVLGAEMRFSWQSTDGVRPAARSGQGRPDSITTSPSRSPDRGGCQINEGGLPCASASDARWSTAAFSPRRCC